VSFDNVLLVADGSNIRVGTPLVQGAKVTATVERHGKGDKKVIIKFRRRKHYKRQGNHRQQYTLVKITAIG
jgi:large subunit ribosomal protein L21